MKLSILERIMILSILPKTSDFVTLKVVRDLQSNVGFTEEEIKNFEITSLDNGNIRWNLEKEIEAGEIEITIGEKATDIIIGSLKTLNDNKQLTDQHFTLYEKFIK